MCQCLPLSHGDAIARRKIRRGSSVRADAIIKAAPKALGGQSRGRQAQRCCVREGAESHFLASRRREGERQRPWPWAPVLNVSSALSALGNAPCCLLGTVPHARPVHVGLAVSAGEGPCARRTQHVSGRKRAVRVSDDLGPRCPFSLFLTPLLPALWLLTFNSFKTQHRLCSYLDFGRVNV